MKKNFLLLMTVMLSWLCFAQTMSATTTKTNLSVKSGYRKAALDKEYYANGSEWLYITPDFSRSIPISKVRMKKNSIPKTALYVGIDFSENPNAAKVYYVGFNTYTLKVYDYANMIDSEIETDEEGWHEYIFKKPLYFTRSQENASFENLQVLVAKDGESDDENNVTDSEDTNIGAEVITTIFQGEGQPPIVGGVINSNVSLSNIKKKGIIVGTSQDEMQIGEGTFYNKEYDEWADDYYESPITLKFFDCSHLNETQFNIPLRLLKANTLYYVKAYIIDKEGNVTYGNVEKLMAQGFNRYDGRYDYANVWKAFDHTLFDVITDEIIEPSVDGFYYSTNENPTLVRYQKGTSYNTCYKFATEWNYKLWYYHNTNFCDKNKVVSMPNMTYNDGKLTIAKNVVDADKDISIYYSIDGNFFRPENYTELYKEPISLSNGHHVCCYAISSDGYISYTNIYVVGEGNSDNTEKPDKPGNTQKYVEVCGVKWAKGNLQYDVIDGGDETFQTGWRIGPAQWHFFRYAENGASYKATKTDKQIDHFTWGVCGDWDFMNDVSIFSTATSIDINSKMYTDKECKNETTDYNEAAYGDLAYWASKGQYRLPTEDEVKTLVYDASYQYGYYKAGDTKIYGFLFTTPNGIRETNENEEEFFDADLDRGLFVPLAGYAKTKENMIRGINQKISIWTSTVNENYPQTLHIEYKIPQQGKYNSYFGQWRTDLNVIRPVYSDASPTNGSVADAVDLGLSVKWASWNVGATSPEEHGNLYAWGELEPKDNYSMSTYKFYNNGYTKYGSVDNKYMLDKEDDVAYQTWGENWRMPTFNELKELHDKCTFESTTLNGTSVIKVTGPNGNHVFFPMPGNYTGETLYFKNSVGSYWSSDLENDSYAKDLDFIKSTNSLNGDSRYHGQSIRPVYSAAFVTHIEMSQSKINMINGGTTQLKVISYPTNVNLGEITWSSSNEKVATVSADGIVTAVGAGTATIKAEVYGSATAECEVTVIQPVSGIALFPTRINLIYIGSTVPLVATVQPTDASDKTVTWSSSDEKVATVSAEGLVTAVGVGEAVVTATSADGGFTANCYVSVTTFNKITYYVDGAEYYTETLEYGTPIVTIGAPEKEGHTFSGWDYVPSTMPDCDVMVRGTFTPNRHYIIYMVDGVEYYRTSCDYGSYISPIGAPEKEGHTFSGWDYAPSTMPDNDVTVRGTFTPNTYYVIYFIDGEEYQRVAYQYGENITVIDAPEREGHTFSGWDYVPSTMPDCDVPVGGTFTPNTYYVIYFIDGEEYQRVAYLYGESITAIDAPEREGYLFSGWSEIPDMMPAHDVMVYTDMVVDGIESVVESGVFSIYTVNGILVKSNAMADDLKKLDKGIYIINGKKMVVK